MSNSLTEFKSQFLLNFIINFQNDWYFSQISGSDASRSITKQRKIASSFRDNHLYETFQLAHDLLRRALESWKSTKFIDETQQTLVSNLLRLALNCLSFDFIGTSPDESSDDLSCESLQPLNDWFVKLIRKIFNKIGVQIPTSWRPAFLDFNTLQLFFDLFHSLPQSLAPLVWNNINF